MGLFDGPFTKALIEVIREKEVDVNQFMGAKFMPSIAMPTSTIYVDIWEARGGYTREHTLDTDPQYIQRRQFRTQQFAPGAYKEKIHFGEVEILKLRELGQNDQSKRGIRQHLEENMLVLNNRIETRMEKLRWAAIFQGTYTYDGNVVSFGVPAANNVLPINPWGLNDGAGNYTTANPAATPIQDLRFWLMGGYTPFRKWKIRSVVMNPNTARMILDNPNVQSLIQTRFAADAYKLHTVENLLDFLIPGMPQVEVYQGWYQDEAMASPSGQITVSDAKYFIPDGSIYFINDLPGNDVIGDVCMTLNLTNGSIDSPGSGKFLVVEDKTEISKSNPYVDLLGGFYGGPRLKRGFDLLTATVI